MRLPYKNKERGLISDGFKHIVAVDEVGIGSLAGPVVVCAVMFNKTFFKKRHKKLRWLRESKLLSPHQREKFATQLLKEKNFRFQIAYVHSKTIDRINIYQAARQAMRKAIHKLKIKNARPRQAEGEAGEKLKMIVLVDGKNEIGGIKVPQLAIVKGDRKVFSIACASIIAKVFRDKMMVRYAKKYPGYGFEQHKGYGTKYHQAQLVAQGPCEIHRKSFAPVAKLI